MDSLSNNIYRYYCDHYAELSFDKQLHFASRLYLWDQDDFGASALSGLRSEVTLQGDPAAALRAVYKQATETIYHGSKNAAGLRAPYFEKYPHLRTLLVVLFRLTFLESVYGLDARAAFFELFDRTEAEELLKKLLADEPALAILSTHAINALYLYNRVVKNDETAFDPSLFLRIAHGQYDLENPIHLQLYIYLYTHCIIGESKFYARRLPDRHLETYRRMLGELETLMGQRFAGINLDNKFEFLVCCKLAGYESKLADRIEAEAALSVSDDGTFLVDRHNTNPQTANSTLDLSEHRNVLYLLTHRASPLAR